VRLESFSISPSGPAIGGTGAGAGNVVAFDGGDGVSVATPACGYILANAVRANSMFSNAGLGIDLGPDGVTPTPVPTACPRSGIWRQHVRAAHLPLPVRRCKVGGSKP
jgi:hypothetical protein